jgi:glycosyltransferase involved in cell wall biosynthesis
VQRTIQERGLASRLTATGFVPPEEVSASFYGADICVLPYRDGASFRRGSLMAALAHGMPIVSTTPRVALSELRDGENVVLVPPRDPRALADAVASLAHDADLRWRIGEGARQLSREFNWERIAARTLEVYHAVIGAQAASAP